MKTIGQTLEDVFELAAAGRLVRGDELVMAAADLFVEFQIRTAAAGAVLGVLVENATQKKRVVADMGAKEKGLFGGSLSQREQDIGNVLATSRISRLGELEIVHARKSFQKGSDIIAQFPIVNAGVPQDVPRQDVEVEVRRDGEVPGLRKDRLDQTWMIEDGVARLRIAQELDQRDIVGRRTGESTKDEVEISGRETLPTIR